MGGGEGGGESRFSFVVKPAQLGHCSTGAILTNLYSVLYMAFLIHEERVYNETSTEESHILGKNSATQACCKIYGVLI